MSHFSPDSFSVRWASKQQQKQQQQQQQGSASSPPPKVPTPSSMSPYSIQTNGHHSSSSNSPPPKGAVVFVDPYGTGCLIAQEMSKRGHPLIAVWTTGFSDEMKLHIPATCKRDLHYMAELEQQPTLPEMETLLKETHADIIACLAGGEAGVDYADALSEHLGLLTNGTDIPNRRDKKLQQELVREVGMRSVRQAGGTSLSEVDDFLKSESYPVVVKPVESAGSDGVKLCASYEEAVQHFELLTTNYALVNGGENTSVLCQEFLKGKEYVVDHVSRDGIHKTTMVWVYDKRPANGAAFVYYGCIPVDSESEEAKVLIPYVRGVLDALGVKHGPSHGEVIITEDGPCLVEMNCRSHGGDGNWRPLAKALTGGYTQVEASVDAYLEPQDFQSLPDKPCSPFQAAGQEVIFVSHSQGTVQSMPGFEVIKKLPSYVSLQQAVEVGTKVEYTVDLVTSPGGVILMNRNSDILARDVEFCRTMELINGFFVYETQVENLKRPRGDEVVLQTVEPVGGGGHRRVFSSDGPNLIRMQSNDRPELRGPLVKRMTTVDASKEIVVVVNPYSTGYLIVKEILSRTYNVLVVWTKDFPAAAKSHVPLTCENLNYFAQVNYTNVADTIQALYKVASTKFRIVACIAGGELGVDVADALSERLEVRTNTTKIPNRRNKQVQQDLVKAAGLRAVRQAAGTSLDDVQDFLQAESYPLVVKPIESTNSDAVKLCHNFKEAKAHAELLLQSQTTSGVLCQEFLRGKEYVVDHVSRDGVHKCTMIWQYDKRPVNGAASVYFGSVPVDSSSSDAKLLVSYVRGVLKALGVDNGPSHAEVVMTASGPCLVELKCRAHGGDGSWKPLASALTGGYTQIDATVDAFLDKQQFKLLPSIPPSPLKAAGQEVILVSFSRGTVKSTPGFATIKELPSFVYLETGVKVGSKVDYTTDLFSGLGSVMLMHKDSAVLQADVEKIRQMESENALFEYEDQGRIIRSGSRIHLKEAGGGQHRRVLTADRPDLY